MRLVWAVHTYVTYKSNENKRETSGIGQLLFGRYWLDVKASIVRNIEHNYIYFIDSFYAVNYIHLNQLSTTNTICHTNFITN